MNVNGISSNAQPVTPDPAGNGESTKLSQLEQKLKQLNTKRREAISENDEKKAEELKKQIEKVQRQIEELRRQEDEKAGSPKQSSFAQDAPKERGKGDFVDLYA